MSARLSPLLLASALALLSGGKMLPQGRAQPVAPTGCESFGPGFVKLGGSDTCVKLGGAVRAEYGITTGGGAYAPSRH